jgi:2-hydroxychromene-2-carboxylate isomerase
MSEPIKVTVYNDPGCPWAYSAVPALRTLEWRYGDQLEWRLVLIGLTERAQQYVDRGYTPLSMATGYADFRRRFGMPFSTTPRKRVCGTGRACRAIAAARVLHPGREWEVFRALQIAWFTTQLLLDEDEGIREAIEPVESVDAGEIIAHIDDPEVERDYQRDHAEARTAAGSATELQGKAAQTDGPVRYTAPSLIVEAGGRRLEAGGFQTVGAYDVLVANIDQSLARQMPPETPEPLFERFPNGLTTQEVAVLMTHGNDDPDRALSERFLLELAADGVIRRADLGDSAVWLPAAA